MTPSSVTKTDRWMAAVCANCPACRQARRKQRGAAYWLVRKVEHGVCPFCRAYEKVHGRKSFAPVSASQPIAE